MAADSGDESAMIEAENGCSSSAKTVGNHTPLESNRALEKLWEKCGKVYVTQPVFYQCYSIIQGRISINDLIPHMMSHELITKSKRISDIINPFHSSDDQMWNLLSHVEKCGKHAYFILYVCLYESREKHLGHRDAVKELQKKAREMGVTAPWENAVDIPARRPIQVSDLQPTERDGLELCDVERVYGASQPAANHPTPVEDIEICSWIDALRSQYKSMIPFVTCNDPDPWPPPNTVVHNLDMIREPKYRYNKPHSDAESGIINNDAQKINLKDIFRECTGERKIVLIEGAPGSGKSTLAIFICQQWGKGELFSEYQVVVLVQLRDPHVQNASCINKLLPRVSNATCTAAVDMISITNGKGVLFILDGWDELPTKIRNDPRSLFNQLIRSDLSQELHLHKSTVVVLSRPIVSGSLQKFASIRITLKGFSDKEVYEYFKDYLDGDTDAVESLIERINDNPEIADAYCLPLNAAILANIFKCGNNSLPSDVVTEMILSRMYHHLKKAIPNLTLNRFEDLPPSLRNNFDNICSLAYQGVEDDMMVFSSQSLPENFNTLGLLQGVQSLVVRGLTVSYSFPHLSVQDYLAARFIATKLSAGKQVDTFNKIFSSSHFTAVLENHATMTNLINLDFGNIFGRIITAYVNDPNNEHKSLVLSALHCLHKAKDPNQCKIVANKLQDGLNFSDISLNTSKCHCVSYFLSCITTATAQEFKLDLMWCKINDKCCMSLTSYFQETQTDNQLKTALFSLNLRLNQICEEGVKHLCKFLRIDCLCTLNLNGNRGITDKGITHIAEQLEVNSHLKELQISKCGFTDKGAKVLARALCKNSSLIFLDISNNVLCDEGIDHIACAMRTNNSLKKLFVRSCGMTNQGFISLAHSVGENKSLQLLKTYNFIDEEQNVITDAAVPTFTEYIKSNHTMTELVISQSLESFIPEMKTTINNERERLRLPCIQIRASGGTLANTEKEKREKDEQRKRIKE